MEDGVDKASLKGQRVRIGVILGWCLPIVPLVFVLALVHAVYRASTEPVVFESTAGAELVVAQGTAADIDVVQHAFEGAVQEIQGPRIRRRTLQRLGMSETQLTNMLVMVSADAEPGAGQIRVSVQSLDPVLAARLANALMDVLVDDPLVGKPPLRGTRQLMPARPSAQPMGPGKKERVLHAGVRGIVVGIFLACLVAILACFLLRR